MGTSTSIPSLHAAVKAADLSDVLRATVSAATNGCLTRLVAFGVLHIDQHLALQELEAHQIPEVLLRDCEVWYHVRTEARRCAL